MGTDGIRPSCYGDVPFAFVPLVDINNSCVSIMHGNLGTRLVITHACARRIPLPKRAIQFTKEPFLFSGVRQQITSAPLHP